ncbi:secreted RxLR effector protein 161-like [Nymphaea colorata]|uniref:secreted RxLR effector protein 161-like n=1 Tax=Nymphaea colorata TaxID=210225 RepID=UPI00129E3764|nr:secreted RxLR effector protein 161-like [Nymphaea colorata]
MEEAKPTVTPAIVNSTPSKYNGHPFKEPSTYRSIVGGLLYATFTRPDIAFAVNKACQFMHDPTKEHWSYVKRILRYLKGTLNLGLHITKSDFKLSWHADADWAGCPDDRRSTGGYLTFLGANLISWSSSKQRTVAKSSKEAEYKAMAEVVAEISWLQQILQELHIPNLLKPEYEILERDKYFPQVARSPGDADRLLAENLKTDSAKLLLLKGNLFFPKN